MLKPRWITIFTKVSCRFIFPNRRIKQISQKQRFLEPEKSLVKSVKINILKVITRVASSPSFVCLIWSIFSLLFFYIFHIFMFVYIFFYVFYIFVFLSLCTYIFFKIYILILIFLILFFIFFYLFINGRGKRARLLNKRVNIKRLLLQKDNAIFSLSLSEGNTEAIQKALKGYQ